MKTGDLVALLSTNLESVDRNALVRTPFPIRKFFKVLFGERLTAITPFRFMWVAISQESGWKLQRNFNDIKVRSFILNGAPAYLRTSERLPKFSAYLTAFTPRAIPLGFAGGNADATRLSS